MPGFLSRALLRTHIREVEHLAGEAMERLARMDAVLGDLLSGEGAPPGFLPHQYLAPGVPRVRPLLVLLSTEAARRGEARSETDPQRAEELAAAAELLHLAVVVHDAALGKQGGRRRRAARRLVGAVGWLGGHHLTLRALELTRNEGPEVLGDLLEALREAAEGHALTQTLQGRPATAQQAMTHAETHTGTVFSFACRSGARLAGAERAVISGLGRYGRHAGIAWHIAEDLSLLDPDAERTEELIEERATSGRPMLAVSLAAERDAQVAALWRAVAQGEAPELVPTLVDQVVQLGALEQGRRQLLRSTWTARRALNTLPPSPHREALDHLVGGLVGGTAGSHVA